MEKTYEITRRHRLDNLSRLLCCCMVVMILFGSVLSPPPANALAITAGMVAIAFLVSAAAGITFSYANNQEAYQGMASAIAKFFDSNPYLEPGEFHSDIELGRVTLGTIGWSVGHVVEDFVNWFAADVIGIEPLAAVAGLNGGVRIGGQPYYEKSVFNGLSFDQIEVNEITMEEVFELNVVNLEYVNLYSNGPLVKGILRYFGKKIAESVQSTGLANMKYMLPVYEYENIDGRYSGEITFHGFMSNGTGLNASIYISTNGSAEQDDVCNKIFAAIDRLGYVQQVTVPDALIPFPEVDEDTDPLIITLPESLWDVTKTLDDNLDTIITDVGTGAVAVPKISEMTQTGTQTDTLDEGINWDILTKLEVFNKFPFSIPTDVYLLVNALVETPVEPRWEFDLVPQSLKDNVAEDGGKVVLEFSSFEGIRQLLRTCLLILFLFGLMLTTKNMIWTGGG